MPMTKKYVYSVNDCITNYENGKDPKQTTINHADGKTENVQRL